MIHNYSSCGSFFFSDRDSPSLSSPGPITNKINFLFVDETYNKGLIDDDDDEGYGGGDDEKKVLPYTIRTVVLIVLGF